MNTFNTSQRIGDIVTKFPKAAEVFKKFRIDFCCGGDRKLISVIEELGINKTEVIDELNSLYESFMDTEGTKDRDWTKVPLDELVDHIVNVHHAYLYENLPKISGLTTQILRVHGDSHPELSKVYKLFHTIKMELDEHLIREETIQYPAIKEFLNTKAEKDLDKAIEIIKQLEEDHTGAGDVLKELRKVTNDYEVPADGCSTYTATYDKLQEMESDLFQHIHLENNILFPRLNELKK